MGMSLEKTGKIQVVGSFTDAGEALGMVKRLSPDVVFLDIEMLGISGLELAEKMMEMGCDAEIVFVTAFEKYALDAFRVNAIDYILKPFSAEDISKAVAKLQKKIVRETVSGKQTKSRDICCFGMLGVYESNGVDVVRWRTSKAEELFAFLLMNLDCEVSKWKIIEVLWPEYEPEKGNVHLHTTVYNIKKTLDAAKIKYELGCINGKYRLTLPESPMDTAEFEQLFGKWTDSRPIENCLKALELYKGRYLEQNEYLWSEGKAEEYARMYNRMVLQLEKHYEEEGDDRSAGEVLQRALVAAPLNDDLNETLLRLYLKNGDRGAATMHYNKMTERYLTELGIEPSEELRRLYELTVK
jgi:two-component system, LytTR family, response regulator